MRRVCRFVCVLSTGLPTGCTQYRAEMLRDEVIGQPGRAGVHAAQPLWLVMMINVGKRSAGVVCDRAWATSEHSKARQPGGQTTVHPYMRR